MTAAATSPDIHPMLPALARVMVEQPRATLQELARAVGVSKATLYRYCRTREELIAQLTTLAAEVVTDAMHRADLDHGAPLDALRRLIANNLEHRELTAFLMHFWRDAPPESRISDADWDRIMDGFFLRGQQAGIFRIDIPAAGLTEVFVGLLLGLMEAERRGRIARSGLAELVEGAFLTGALARPASAPQA